MEELLTASTAVLEEMEKAIIVHDAKRQKWGSVVM
jgi:hypothetical protein